MAQTKFTTIPKENWDSEETIEEKNQCAAADGNQLIYSILKTLERAGIEGSSDYYEMARAIMLTALCSDYFTDESTEADTIVLTDNGTFEKPTAYVDGMKVSFIPLYSNTGATTINVNGLGVKNVYADSALTPLTENRIKQYSITNLRYNLAIDGFIIASGMGEGGSSRGFLGEIISSTLPLTDAGLHLADGSLILAGGIYNDFYLYMKDLYDGGLYPDLFETEVNWQTSVSTYGVCGKYVFEDGVSVRLPKISGFVEGTIDTATLGNLTTAGLPNITGTTYGCDWATPAGAFSFVARGAGAGMGTGVNNPGDAYFNASSSNPIYGNSTTVQPQSIKVLYYICVATSVKTDIVVDIDEIATDLAGKVDKDGSNATFTNLPSTAKQNITDLSFPSSRYDDISLLSSGSTYTAPADGWYVVYASAGTNPVATIGLYNLSAGDLATVWTPGNGGNPFGRAFIPISKGQTFQLDYGNLGTGAINLFRFVYANGN